jgi:integrase/recombinase XerD
MSSNPLFDKQGNRLYMNAEERKTFLEAAAKQKRKVKVFCEVLHYSGCRISEALELTARNVDLVEESLHIRCLKKRNNKIVYRSVPVPPSLIENLDMVFGIREIQQKGRGVDDRLWSWTRGHAWLLVKQVMNEANIPDGAHKTAKGLRHGYGVAAIQAGVQLNMLQKWMGHYDMKITAIYANALGSEERDIAARMWG